MMYLSLTILVLASLALGIHASRHLQSDSESYFIGGRALNRWAVGISAGATANSGFIVVGAVGMGYSMGLSSLIYPLAWLLGDLLFWFAFSEKINLKGNFEKAITIPQLISESVSSEGSSRGIKYLSAIIIFSLLIVYSSAQFIASGKALSSFFDISIDYAMYVTFGVVIGYCIWGGFKSSVWTDLLQGIGMLLLTSSVLVWGLIEIGGISSFLNSITSFGSQYFDLSGGRSPLLLVVFILGFAFAGFGFSMSQPQVTTRIMAAANKDEVRKARWIYIGFLHFTWMGMCVIGMMARILLPDLNDGETALPQLASEFFHPVFVGAVVAGILATIFSSLDSLLVSSAGTLSVDFGIDSQMSVSQRKWWYKLSIMLVGLLALTLSMYMQSTVFQTALFAANILAASIGSAMTIVLLRLPRTQRSIIASITTGLVIALIWRVSELNVYLSDGLVGFVGAMVANMIFASGCKSYGQS